MKKNIATIICFILVLSIISYHFIKTYSFKHYDGAYVLKAFYNQNKNINDVIFFGSSHIFEDVNTEILWDEYGIASFDLAGSGQPIWNSYYYIKEALKTQSPQLIVLDLYSVCQTEDYIDTSRIIKNTYGMKFSLDKINAIQTSAPKEERIDYLLEIPTYHMRYNELTSADYLANTDIPNWEAWKGFLINGATISADKPSDFQTEEIKPLTEKVEEYLRKICQLCHNYNVNLLLIKSPYVTDLSHTMMYNRAAEIAKEYNIPFVNFNYHYDEMGLDFSTDMADYSHLNYKGNIKFTRYLAEYIKNNYSIPDRRGEQGFESYDIISLDCVMRTKNAMIYDTYDIDTFLSMAQNDNYIVIYSVCGNYKDMHNYDDVKCKLSSYGIDLNSVNASSVWVMQKGVPIFASENLHDYLWHTELAPYKTLEISAGSDSDNSTPSIIFNQVDQTIVSSGINIVVYDTITETIVDAVGFPIYDDSLYYIKQHIIKEKYISV